jgi:HlyD family secretion protein
VARPDTNPLFRREALNSLNSIDELDRLVTVTHPRAWLTLAAVGLLIAAALAWAFAGQLTITVNGSGILLRGGHTMRAVSTGGGQITALLVDLGDKVRAGDAIARVASPELQAAVDRTSAEVDRLTAVHAGLTAAAPVDEQALATTDDALREAQAALARARTDLAEASRVLSPYSGVVSSVEAYQGQYMTPGTPLMTIEPLNVALRATLYLPDKDGKQVRLGQQVQIMPESVSAEEYGYLRAKVTSVDALPATPESMQAVLQNEFLVQELAAQGTVLRIEATLTPAPENPSGYAWSSSSGPDLRISSGTTVSARVVLSQDPPITYVFPQLKRLTGDSE